MSETGFFHARGALVCDGVPLGAIARAIGTPAYVYSAALIRSRYRALDGALGARPHTVHYALKANSALAVVRLLAALGGGADANSGGEIAVALRAGFDPSRIVFTGVGKTPAELEQAVALGVKAINAESAGELDRLAAIARAAGRTVPIALRVNPEIDARSHPHISTALRASPFGVPLHRAVEIAQTAARQPGLRLVGVHVHIGSQIRELEPLVLAARTAADLARTLLASGVPLGHLDLGGGLGIAYDGSPVPGLDEYAAALVDAVGDLPLELLVEPGRALVGPAGALLTQVIDVKERPDGKPLVVLDAGMTELLRPALYDAFHRIAAVEPGSGPEICADLVGPLCESSDVVGTDRRLARPAPGDVLAVLDTGAYGAAMGSTYNRRLLPPEVLVDEGQWTVVRRRQTIEDQLELER